MALHLVGWRTDHFVHRGGGIYLSKIYSETKRRPYTIVREVYRKT